MQRLRPIGKSEKCRAHQEVSLCWRKGGKACPYVVGWNCPEKKATKTAATPQKEEVKMATKKKAAKKVAAKKESAAKLDKYGFREGSHVSQLFAKLLKGAKMEELKTIAGAATYKTIAEFKMGVGQNARGRAAKIEFSDKGIYKIVSYKTPKA